MNKRKFKCRHSYEIKISGHISRRRFQAFEGWKVAPTADGQTTISAEEIDQSALFGLLIGIRDLGIPLISVRRILVKE